MLTRDKLDEALRLAVVEGIAARGELPARRVEDAYEVLRHVQQAKADLADAEREAVTYYRELGATWDDVGEALGMSKQGAHERFREPAEA